MKFTATTLALTLALTASSTPLKRQTPSRFVLFFAAQNGEPESEMLVTQCGNETPQHQCIAASPSPDYVGAVEPLFLNENFVFTSYNASATAGQDLIVNTQQSQNFDLTVPHSGYLIPAGFTHDGFSVENGVLAFNGSTTNFYACQRFVPPGGVFPLLAVEPIDLHALGSAGCSQRTILAKTSAVGK